MTTLHVLPSGADDALLAGAHALVVDAFGGDFAAEDWQHALGGVHVLAREGDVLVAHAAVVVRTLVAGDRPVRTGYVEAVAVRADRRGRGLGGLVMREVARQVRAQTDLGALSTGLHAFYARLGWERWRGPTWVRTPEGDVRTPDEDDGVMVLRHGPTAGLDLALPLVCEARAGDAW